MTTNPFRVNPPEGMSAEQVVKLYVPVAERLEIEDVAHAFIHGHRGCGKSMMLRHMAPDCQMLMKKRKLGRLPYLGIYATIKTASLDVVEYERIKDQYVGVVLAEHALVSFMASKACQSLLKYCADAIDKDNGAAQLKTFMVDEVLPRLATAGLNTKKATTAMRRVKKAAGILEIVSGAIDEAYARCASYLQRGAFTSEYRPYQGPLLGYRDFLFPMLTGLTKLRVMPYRKPVYVLLDDADNLNVLQTQILNTWVSYRTADLVCFKISTQLAYKTYHTTANQLIEYPHDFREFHVSSIHTGSASHAGYPQWVDKVVQRRLKEHGIKSSTKTFFPVDAEQEQKIKVIAARLKGKWLEKPRGFRPEDDAYRYARADYIKELGGKSKQRSTYKYAGFQQLVHISSGIIRFFLDNASQMYSEQEIKNNKLHTAKATVFAIDPSIQDDFVRKAADNLLHDELDKLEQDAIRINNVAEINQCRQLRNLIRALGAIFQEILLSNRSERRVFSIALSDDPPKEIMDVLRLGVRHGYFYQAYIGSKEGRWRTKRYVMTRRLAPHFKLDPMGFSGYLFVTSDLLQQAITNPNQAVESFKVKRLGIVVSERQLALGI